MKLMKMCLATIVLAALSINSPAASSAVKPDDELLKNVPRVLRVASAQYEFMLDSLKGMTNLPRTTVDGKVKAVAPRDWTSGFFPGSLWYLFEYTGDAKWKTAAADYTVRLDSVKKYRGTHDLGFMLYCSYGNGFRLTGNPGYREVLLEGAGTLGGRFNPQVGLIRSWDFGSWKYPVIIDNMMNLELLTWAERTSKQPKFKEIAISHADRTIQNHFRPDASTWHVVDYDPANGSVLKKQTHQGFSDDSAWARGQAWGLYGYVMMFRETGKSEYRDQAVKIANFLAKHPRLPADKIPYWDFDAPKIPDEPRDASAGAIIASALLELADQVEADASSGFRALARQQLLSLASPAYLAEPGSNGGFLLRHCVGNRPGNAEIDVPLAYADYYFLEALLRYDRYAKSGKALPVAQTVRR